MPGSLACVVDTEEHFRIDFPVDPIKQGILESSCFSVGHGSHFHGILLDSDSSDYFMTRETSQSLSDADHVQLSSSYLGRDPRGNKPRLNDASLSQSVHQHLNLSD